MFRTLFILISVLMVLALPACSRPAEENAPVAPSAQSASPVPGKITSESVVRVAVQGIEISPGGSVDADVQVSIQGGFHINSNPPTFPYLKATELEMVATDDISLKSVVYPKPLVKKFAFSDRPLDVYEGYTVLKASLQAATTAKKGQHSIPAKLRIQACDDQVCYAPGSIEVAVPVLVK